MSNTIIGRRSFTGHALVAAGGLVAGSRIVTAHCVMFSSGCNR